MTSEKQFVKLKDIKPYWRNPRINDTTVEALKESITKYGFNVPLVLDKNLTIVTGHARYKALTQLNWEDVWVHIVDLSEEDAKRYRLADNKVAELSQWDNKYLRSELMELRNVPGFSQEEVDKILKDDLLKFENMTPEEIAAESDKILTRPVLSRQEFFSKLIEVTCPHCKGQFSLNPKELK